MKETKELFVFVLALATAIVASKEDDGKITVGDLPNFFPVLTSAPNAFIGADQIGNELRTMTQEEKQELSDLVRERFDIADDELEEIIKDAFDVGLSVTSLVVRVSHYVKSKRE